ncbi:Hypothetical protein DHA2_150876 [Giardia duodenalis]|uniref:Uncharacterized protein n=1 Tax=Giardia intestinalis TaxID=5741 RepID=V6T784_GIAIN|nr:Hypothetical protein DHA2_150876 [Giardia intestinalis]
MLAIMHAPWWMSMAAARFGIWDGRISLSSPSTLCLSSFASLRCSVSCLALSHGRPQSQRVCPAGRANVFGVVSQAGTHGLLFGVSEVPSCVQNVDRVFAGSPSPQIQLCTLPVWAHTRRTAEERNSSSLPLLWSLSYSIANPRLRTSPKIEREFTREICGQRPQARAPAAHHRKQPVGGVNDAATTAFISQANHAIDGMRQQYIRRP